MQPKTCDMLSVNTDSLCVIELYSAELNQIGYCAFQLKYHIKSMLQDNKNKI